MKNLVDGLQGGSHLACVGHKNIKKKEEKGYCVVIFCSCLSSIFFCF